MSSHLIHAERMKHLIPLLLIAISCQIFTCCSTSRGVPVQEGMDTWLGATKHQLMTIWGVPSSSASDANGGEIVTYYWVFRRNSGSVRALTQGQYTDIRYTTPQTFVSQADVFIDSNGKIYHWRTNFTKLWKSNLNPY